VRIGSWKKTKKKNLARECMRREKTQKRTDGDPDHRKKKKTEGHDLLVKTIAREKGKKGPEFRLLDAAILSSRSWLRAVRRERERWGQHGSGEKERAGLMQANPWPVRCSGGRERSRENIPLADYELPRYLRKKKRKKTAPRWGRTMLHMRMLPRSGLERRDGGKATYPFYTVRDVTSLEKKGERERIDLGQSPPCSISRARKGKERVKNPVHASSFGAS